MNKGLANLPSTDIVRVLIDFTQWLFSKSQFFPDGYKWDPDEKRSLIRISKPFSIDDEKPLSRPYIIISRSATQLHNRVFDNLAKADPNDFSNPERVDLMSMNVIITAGAGTADEAANLSAFVLHAIHANRHLIKSKIPYIHELKQVAINPEQPRQNQTSSTVHVWEATSVLSTVLKIGWFEKESDDAIIWDSMEIVNQGDILKESPTGQVFKNSNILKDEESSFGFDEEVNDVVFTEEGIEKGYYFISIDGQPYLVKEVVNENMIRLVVSNAKGQPVDFVFEEEKKEVKYKVHWNKPYVRMVVPVRQH